MDFFVRSGEEPQDKTGKSKSPGRFFHRDFADFASVLSQIGWNVRTPDNGLINRDPIGYFTNQTLDGTVGRRMSGRLSSANCRSRPLRS